MVEPVGRGAARAGTGTIELTWLGQAGFRVDAGDCHLLIDPFFSEHPLRTYRPERREAWIRGVTAVLCTHEHDDHLDLPFLCTLMGDDPRPEILVPAPVVDRAAGGGLPRSVLRPAPTDEAIELAGAKVWAVPSCHGFGGDAPVEYGTVAPGDPPGTHRFVGYVVEAGGVRLYHAGDTVLYDGLVERMEALRPDVMIVPINGRDYMREATGCVGNLTQEEAAWLCRQVGSPIAIPTHYDAMEGNTASVGRFVDAIGPEGGVTAMVLPRGVRTRVAVGGQLSR